MVVLSSNFIASLFS
jgi:protein-S-isoprenylcysteine O-methyltransferase Ste14